MLVVARRWAPASTTPSQLKDVVGSEISREAMLAPLADVRRGFEEFQQQNDGRLDKIAKRKRFHRGSPGSLVP
jgi:hypothetical protein